MKALIVGGGVAGLSTAIALRKVGVDAQVFERAPEIRDIGAGKSLWRNGVQALDWLSVAGGVTEAGSPIDEIRVLSSSAPTASSPRSGAASSPVGRRATRDTWHGVV